MYIATCNKIVWYELETFEIVDLHLFCYKQQGPLKQLVTIERGNGDEQEQAVKNRCGNVDQRHWQHKQG